MLTNNQMTRICHIVASFYYLPHGFAKEQKPKLQILPQKLCLIYHSSHQFHLETYSVGSHIYKGWCFDTTLTPVVTFDLRI